MAIEIISGVIVQKEAYGTGLQIFNGGFFHWEDDAPTSSAPGTTPIIAIFMSHYNKMRAN